MKRIGLHLVFILLVGVSLQGQYEYFNMTQGLNESSGNIEVIGNDYYIMGAGQIDGETCWFFRKLDDEGNQVAQACYFFPSQYHYLGITSSFQKVPGQDLFLHTQGVVDQGLVKGFAMMLDSDLDTLWSSVYETYDPDTYLYTHTWDGDGFILAGETLEPGDGRGTFIMKIDTLGNVLWHNLIHAPWEGIFRNRDISVVEGGYVWSGAEGVAENTTGRIEMMDEEGILQWFIAAPSGSGAIRHSKLADTIVTAQAYKYADYENSTNPQFAYSYLRLSYLSLSTQELLETTDIDVGVPWVSNGVTKTISGSDNGYVTSGTFYKPVTNQLELVSYIVKTNEEFQLEWYTELAFDQCLSCENILYDIELAPDGGYIMVGTFTDTSIDFNPRTWLVKVDACGDLEWQGCAPVGMAEFEIQSSNDRMKLEIWPNPYPAGSSAPLGVRFPQEVIVEKVVMVDARGRIIPDSKFKVQGSYSDNLESAILNLEFLAPGLYSLLITTRDGDVYSGKVMIE